jgi:hypothetical protein
LDTIRKTLRYEEREYGINLGWGNTDTGDNIRFQRPSGSKAPIVYEEDIAICVNNGKWVKYGEREYGINLVWSDDPVFEWKIKGQSPGVVVTKDQIVGLSNNVVPPSPKTVMYGERRYGINLVWSNVQ